MSDDVMRMNSGLFEGSRGQRNVGVTGCPISDREDIVIGTFPAPDFVDVAMAHRFGDVVAFWAHGEHGTLRRIPAMLTRNPVVLVNEANDGIEVVASLVIFDPQHFSSDGMRSEVICRFSANPDYPVADRWSPRSGPYSFEERK